MSEISTPIIHHKTVQKIHLTVLQIVLTLFLITFLLPALWMVSSSLKVSTEVFAHPIVWIPERPQWNNYARIFEILPFGRFMWNTVVITGLAVLGTVISSVLVGYSFARLNWPGKNFFFGLMISTMFLPEIVTLIPRFMIFRELKWIDTFYPLIVPHWFAVNAVYIFLVNQFLRGLPIELEEAALIDGANRFQILTQIILPLSKPVIASITVFALLQHYNAFIEPLIFLRSMDNWTMALGIRALNDTNVQNWELVFAAGTMMVAPVLLLFIFAQRYFVQGIALTGFGGR
ncbi:MAG: sugar ABC transporter ATP-binding protein [Anaerolineae bacterium]|nr:MAG: sugar ABC transporter ATP-binding protein [Anaerolineae bacterium]